MLIEYNGVKPKIGRGVFIAPTATLVGNVTVGNGCSIWYGSVLRGDLAPIFLEDRVNIQDKVLIHVTPAVGMAYLEEGVSVGHGAILHSCRLKKGVVVGMKSVVLDGAEVGEYSLVAAGTVISSRMKVPARNLVTGTHAKIKGSLRGELLHCVECGADWQVRLAVSYLNQGLGHDL